MATWYSRTWKSGKVSWYTKVKDARGEWKPRLLKAAKTEAQAKKLALEIERESERAGHGLIASTPYTGTFADLCAWANEAHFKHQGSPQPDASRLKAHAGDPDAGTATWLGALPLRQVTGPKIAQYFTELTESLSPRGKPYSPGSINRIRAQFATVFELAKEHGKWMGDNPVHATKARPEVKASFDILEAHEVAPTLEHTPHYWRGCLATGILTALRKGELFGLEKRDVDLERRVLLVRRSHGRQTTKGGTHAAVPIHEDLIPYLEEWLDTPGPMLFPDTSGKRRSHQVNLPAILQRAMARAGFIERWEYVCRRSGCGFRDEQPQAADQPGKRDCPDCSFRLQATPRARNIRWHEGTRHTLASHALMSGASLASVQAILRHADPRLTIQTYGHLSAGFLGQEVNRVNLPGLTRAADGEQTGAKQGETVEPGALLVHSLPGRRGAPMVRARAKGLATGQGKVMNQHQNSLESSWSRGVSNPRPMHCEGNGVLSPVAPPRGTASQVFGFARPGKAPDSTPLPPVPPCPPGRGAPMVRKRGLTHHDPGTAYVAGSGRTAGELLTVQQVADRLAVGRTWVRRRIESGDLPTVKAHRQAPQLIPAQALADYLARFPGIEPPAPPAPPAAAPTVAPARSRKGAA